MRTRLFLNPSNNKLVGNYNPLAEHIHIILDSSIAAFSVRLPDVTKPEHKEFIFYNYPKRGTGNTVRLLPVSGQLMVNNDTYHDINPGDTVSCCADLKNRWLLSDINSGSFVIDHDENGLKVDNPWRLIIVGDDLLVQRLESGIWTEKSRFQAQSSL